MRRISLLISLCCLLCPTVSWAMSDAERKCFNMVRMTDLSYAIEPGALVPATDKMPEYCRVRGVINRAIRFEVTLPSKDWNGRLMFSTVGGSAGTIGDTQSLLASGYAMASTDTGHELAEGNSYLKQPEALLDYAYRGVHLASVAAKKVITHYYDKDIEYSYVNGCSNGGRAALLEATRFPEDYDGVIAGAPAFKFQEFTPWMLDVHRKQSAHPLTKESLRLLHKASSAACDKLDGIEDGVIDDPRQCIKDKFDVNALACKAEADKDCLTKGQIETANVIYNGTIDPQGNVISPGVLPGAEAGGDWAFWMLPNEQFGGESIVSSMEEMIALIMRHHPDFKIEEFAPATDNAQLTDAMAPVDVRSVDLSEFKARGGKLLIYQGWNDFPLRPQRAIDYLEDVQNAMGGAEKTSDFLRLFMVPGMLHCAGGPGPWQADYVTPLVAWREKGEAPDRIVGTQPGAVVPMAHLEPDESMDQALRFTRPLCVYPKYAKYSGKGDTNDEKNFACVTP